MNALTIKTISKSYPTFSLDGLNMELPKGCIMGLVGENGAGKSTTIKCILKQIDIDSGEILVFGEHVSEKTMDDIGVVLDEGCLPDKMNAQQLGKLMSRFYKNWDSERYEQLLQNFSLDSKKKFSELSRGMKMKLSLAIAMSHDAHILILDEATSGLDVVAREEVLDMLLDFISDGERSVLISSHIVSDLEKICDYICFIHKGKRLFLDEKDMLMEKYCVVRCSNTDFAKIPKEHIIGSRRSGYNAEALMEKKHAPHGLLAEKAGIEDIIIFHVRGNEND